MALATTSCATAPDATDTAGGPLTIKGTIATIAGRILRIAEAALLLRT